jgi:hypothetical protein
MDGFIVNFISMPLPLGFLMHKQSQGFQSIHVLTYLIVPHVTKLQLFCFIMDFHRILKK